MALAREGVVGGRRVVTDAGLVVHGGLGELVHIITLEVDGTVGTGGPDGDNLGGSASTGEVNDLVGVIEIFVVGVCG